MVIFRATVDQLMEHISNIELMAQRKSSFDSNLTSLSAARNEIHTAISILIAECG